MKNISTKKALLYNPYLDVLGGGERHVLSMMNVIAEAGYSVDIAWDDTTILDKIHTHLDIKVDAFTCIPNVFRENNSHKRNGVTANYDIFIYVTDGSYFVSKAKQNYIFAMYPLKSLYTWTPLTWLKLRNYAIIANGDFTADRVRDWLKRETHVLYPYIDTQFFQHNPQKAKTIMSVGRIFQHLHSKRHDIVIDAFIKLKNDYDEFKDFNLEVIGGLKKEDEEYLTSLQKMTEGRSDITFHVNISYDQLRSKYASAMFYWHAGGFDIDEDLHPESVEHVGITPLEAMASGCVTFCYDAGGPKRYIDNGRTGYLYSSIDDLIYKTHTAFQGLQKTDDIVQSAQAYVSEHFSYPVFKNAAEQIFKL